MAHSDTKRFLVGVFSKESNLLSSVKKLRADGVKIHEVYTPYPVHHLDEYLGYKYSRLSKAAFIFGATGTFLAILMQTYMLGIAWPMVIGGKDFVAPPDFVPVTFELTVLLSALGMVATFLISNNLMPWRFNPYMFDPRSTDDKYVMAIDMEKNSKFTDAQLEEALKGEEAEVEFKTVEAK